MTEKTISIIILWQMRQILNLLLPQPALPLIAGNGLHVHWRWGWLKGWFYRGLWSLGQFFGGPQVTVGKRFSVQGRLRIRGPGRVILGSDILVDGNTDLFTHSRQACIRIGNCIFLNGTRMGCEESIEVGDLSILADARIMDTNFHSVARDRNHRKALIVHAPVRIGKNVWVAAQSAILKGVTIGDDSVIGFGAVVSVDMPSGMVISGNPARALHPLPDSISPSILKD